MNPPTVTIPITAEVLERATEALWQAELLAGNGHGLSKGDCRMLARLAIEAALKGD